MKKQIILTVCLLMALASQAQISATFDTASILIGDQTTLTITGTRQYPTMDELTQNNLVPIQQWIDTIDGKECQHTLITSFEEGEHYLKLSDDDSLLLIVNDVADVDTASVEIKDIAGIMKEPYTFWEIFRWVLLAFLIAALGVAAWYIAKRIKANKPIIELPKAPEKPADERAQEALESLRLRQLWQQGKVKEYHTELTDIVRGFIEECYGINSTEMTTDQTLEAFEGTKACTPDNTAMLRQILQTADMVKFAKCEPQPYEHDRSMNDAKSFVASCKQPTAETLETASTSADAK